MLRIGIIIFYVLSVLSEPTCLEYLPPFYERAYASKNTRSHPLGYGNRANPYRGEMPVAYLYMSKNANPPGTTQCINCLYESYKMQGDNMNPCKCLPCWIETSGDEEVQSFVIGIFQKYHCGETRQRWPGVQRKRSDEKIDNFRILGKEEWEKLELNLRANGRDAKYLKDYPKDRDEKTKSWDGLRAFKNAQSSSKSKKCSGEECEVAEMERSLRDGSPENVKEKEQRVFSSILRKMVRLNRAGEEEKTSEKSDDVSTRNRWQMNRSSEEELQWRPIKRYQNNFQKPSFRVISSPHRSNRNRNQNQKSLENTTEEDKIPIEEKSTMRSETIKSTIPNRAKSKGRKPKTVKKQGGRSDDITEAIPEDISIGSLFYEEPIDTKNSDSEELELDDEENDEGEDDDDDEDHALTEVFHTTEGSSEGYSDHTANEMDYNIHYDDDASEETPTEHTKLRETTYPPETRNTPSESESHFTTALPDAGIKRAEMDDTTPSEDGELGLSESSTTTEEQPAEAVSDENESSTSSDESSATTPDSTETSNDEGTINSTKKTGAKFLESNTLVSEESTATSTSQAIVLRFSESSKPSEEPITETTISTPVSTEFELDPSSESIVKDTESRETTIKFGRKFTRSTNPTTEDSTEDSSPKSKESDENYTVTAESTVSDKLLRHVGRYEALLGETTPERSAVVTKLEELLNNDKVHNNTTQKKNPRYIIELKEDSEESGEIWSPEEPILKLKMNVYSDFKPHENDNLLSKLIQKNRESEILREGEGLQIEGALRNAGSEPLYYRRPRKIRKRD